MPIAWSWLLIDLQVPTVHYCILISSVSFAPFLEGGGYWLLFPQDLSQWIADSQFISQQRNTLSAGLICHYQHTFVSRPSIQLAFPSFNGTGTLHDPMAMNSFMLGCGANQFLCKGYLESVYSIAQNNSSKQTQKEGKSKQQTQEKKLNINLKERNWATNSKKKLKTTPRML